MSYITLKSKIGDRFGLHHISVVYLKPVPGGGGAKSPD